MNFYGPPEDDDGSLFEQPPPRDDCPLCFIGLPPFHEQTYMPCCGQIVCTGCLDAVFKARSNPYDPLSCPFCRGEVPGSDDGSLEQLRKRVDIDDANAMMHLGSCFDEGSNGVSRDATKAIELYTRASELGNMQASARLGDIYNPEFDCGIGLERDQRDRKKCTDYYKMAAKGGHEQARYNLGALEANAGNVRVGMKHYIIAASAGHDYALANVKGGYIDGDVTKDEFANTLRAHKNAQDEMKSDHRKKKDIHMVRMRKIG